MDERDLKLQKEQSRDEREGKRYDRWIQSEVLPGGSLARPDGDWRSPSNREVWLAAKAEAVEERRALVEEIEQLLEERRAMMEEIEQLRKAAKVALKYTLDEAEGRNYDPPADSFVVAELEAAIAEGGHQ